MSINAIAIADENARPAHWDKHSLGGSCSNFATLLVQTQFCAGACMPGNHHVALRTHGYGQAWHVLHRAHPLSCLQLQLDLPAHLPLLENSD